MGQTLLSATVAETVLRSLARKANGLTGADVERLVREARQTARRQRRSLAWPDLDAILSSAKPIKPESLRWRIALHESAHAIARLVLDLDVVTRITIDGVGGGGLVEGEETSIEAETEERVEAVLIVKLAGRAAEQDFLGSVTAGAGGSLRSDLAGATQLALEMEVAFGFGRDMPLLYRAAEDRYSMLIYQPEIASRVNARLEEAYAKTRDLVRRNRAAIEELARALMRHDTLEGRELADLLQRVRETVALAVPVPPANGKPDGDGKRRDPVQPNAGGDDGQRRMSSGEVEAT